MIEQKFKVPKSFQPVQRINDIRAKLGEILGAELDLDILKPPVLGHNGATYVIRGNRLKVSIWYDPDAVTVDRPGLSVHVSAKEKEQEFYAAIIDIFGLD